MKTKKDIEQRLKRERAIEDNLWTKFWNTPDYTKECEMIRKKLCHQAELISTLKWVLK